MPNHATAGCRATVVLVLVGLSGLAACGGDSSSKPTHAGPPAKLDVVSGDAQHGTVGKELSQPLVVRVVDAQQRPVSGQTVNFHVTVGGGSVFAGTSTTNGDGVAQERWTLGTTAGADQTVEARAVDNATGQAIVFATFHATAVADVASRIAIATAPGTSLKSGAPISPQPAVRLTDTYGNAVAQSGVTVLAAITPPTNGHALTGQSAIATNAEGIATFTNLAVTGAAGALSLSFSANGLTSAQSGALTLAAGAPATIAATGATALTGNAGQPLAQLPTVVVKDAAGNGVAGVTVLFAISQNGGSISPSSAGTNANGEAALTQWTLPTATGSYMLVASSPALSSGNVAFTVTVLPGAASRLTAKGGDGTSAEVGSVGTVLVAHATDEFGNAIAGANVGWAITAGGGSLSTAVSMTDANGDAETSLTLPQTSGLVHITASLAGGSSTSFTVSATAGAPAALALASPPSSSAASGVTLVSQPIVELRDRFGNVVPRGGVLIHAEVSSPYSLTGSATMNTDVSGRATFTGLAVSGPVGTAILGFVSSGLTGVTGIISVGSGPTSSLTAVGATSIVDTAGAQVTGTSLPAVIAKDVSGNPTAGVAVTFTVGSEGGTVSADGGSFKSSVSLTTGTNGIAALAGWRLPTSAGETRVTAVGSTGTVLFHATVNAGSATSLLVSRQPSSTVQTGVALSPSPQVRLRDQFGNIVAQAGVTITASIGSLYSITAGATVTTDATGLASFDGMTITGPTGPAQLTFQATGLQQAVSTSFTVQGVQPPRTPYVQVVSGAGQSGQVGTALPNPLVARVVDSVGTPTAGVDVIWEGPGGGGTLSPTLTTSDASGLVQTMVTALPTLAGTYDAYARLSVDQSGTRVARFPTTMTAGPAATIVRLSGDQQTVPAGQTLPVDTDISVRDQYGNGVPGVATQWTASNGGSAVVANGGISVGTGAQQGGVVSAKWTLGTTVGQQTLKVTAGSLSLTFSATATQPPGGLNALVPVSNSSSSFSVGSTLTLIVKAVDASGSAISGVPVTWSAQTSGNNITSSSTTDQTGQARATATLSTVAQTNTFTASVTGSSVAPVTFTVVGTPGRACRLVFSNLGQTADRGDPVPLNVQVAAYDSLNNPVPNFPVSIFFQTVGSYDVRGTISALQTDNTGLASTGGAVTLGSPIGDQAINQNTVRPCGWNNAPFAGLGVGLMHANATPVTSLVDITQQHTTSVGSSILLRVRAVDRHGFYVPNAPISATVTSGDGSFNGGSTATTTTANSNGSTEPGTATLTYTVGSASNQQITISSAAVSLVVTITRNP